ncbi:MAG: S9 family peptidase [Pseudomonadota bacterium]
MSKQIAPYGTWDSSITPELMVASNIGLSQARVFNGELYWVESRPQEQGRSVICKQALQTSKAASGASAASVDVLPADYNCRTRVHEYGGACYLPTSRGIFFVNFDDQQVYCIDNAGAATKLTNAAGHRFADFDFCEVNHLLIATAERHADNLNEPQNFLVAIDIDSGEVNILHEGHDFYASARLSPDGTQLCWLTWNHPNMPWDGTDLWVAAVTGNQLSSVQHVAGGNTESVFQPEWSPHGSLVYVSDRSNWWNLYAAEDHRCLCDMPAEFGMPQWVFGMRRYAFLDDNTIVTSYTRNSVESIATIHISNGDFNQISRNHSSYDAMHAADGYFCYIAQSPNSFPTLYVSDAQHSDQEQKIISSSTLVIEPAELSTGAAISYPSANGVTAHGFFYAPASARFAAPADELPPLIVMIHGGPTSATHNDLSLKIQFWTSRGFAVFDANYRGSTGYGREYRDALKAQWGVADVEDCDHAVGYLAQQKLIDPARVAIRGGSAGGYTTLAALAGTDAFKAGASLYGVTDLTALATDTHKFESRYLDSLIGPYPEQEALYVKRSPINQVDSINCPVIFLQGLDDKIVPPNQAEMMIDVLTGKGVKVAYVPFEGEGHGFRQSDNIIKAFGAELWFYAQVFGFDAEPVEGVDFI